jgi:uncharacterized protein (TIGR02001 family)
MIESRKLAAVCGAASLALHAVSGAAVADGYEDYSAPPPPPTEARKFTYSFNIAGTSDYVFRGISQTDNDPTVQGGIDFGYGIFYLGAWASGLDFDVYGNDAEVEIDWYGGIKPSWGPVNFDFGAIYYSYPGATFVGVPGGGADLSYWEIKGGISGEPIKNLALGLNIYYSPDYFGETSTAWTFEGNAGYTFRPLHFVVPSITGVVGYQDGNGGAYLAANGYADYWYWNAGLALAVEALTFDFRYWGTDADNATSTTLTCVNNLCDDRFVFTAKIALP